MTSNTEAAGAPAGPELRAVIGQRMLIVAGATGSVPQGSPATLDDFHTFGANLGNLGEYGISDSILELAEAGTRIARQAAGALIAHHPAKCFST
jgi:methionine synthase I (cobalamin-dependent)